MAVALNPSLASQSDAAQEAAFVTRMNARALQLGLTSVAFFHPYGGDHRHDDDNTPREMVPHAASTRDMSRWFAFAMQYLFMSVLYPTIDSKGISCLPKSDHGAGAGVILFFTCVSAVIAPLAIGAVSDALGQITYGFWLATAFAAVLFAGMLLNWLANPTRDVLDTLDRTEYRIQEGT